MLESDKNDESTLQALAVALVQGAARASRHSSASKNSLLAHPAVTAVVAKAVARSRIIVVDKNRRSEDRVRAVANLALAPFEESRDTFVALLAGNQPLEIQLAAVTALGRWRDRKAVTLLIDRWTSFTPRLRAAAMEGLLTDKASTDMLLAAVEAGTIPQADVEPARIVQLIGHPSQEISKRARSLFAAPAIHSRSEVVQTYQGALALKGSADKGRTIFRTVCASCHCAESQGHELGPNLATVQNRGAESIVLNILDPNREVNPQ
jgi:mono/diheme cytochrome c family protein